MMSSAHSVNSFGAFCRTTFNSKAMKGVVWVGVLFLVISGGAVVRFGSLSSLLQYLAGRRVLLSPDVALAHSQPGSVAPYLYCATFDVENLANEPILISKVAAECGCLTLKVDGDNKIPAGVRQRIQLTIKLKELAPIGSTRELVFITSPPLVIRRAVKFVE